MTWLLPKTIGSWQEELEGIDGFFAANKPFEEFSAAHADLHAV